MKTEIRIIPASELWALRHEVMWPNESIDYVKLSNDESGIHYGLFIGSDLVSVVSLFTTNNEGQFRKFATKVSEQGKGYGSQLLSFLMKEVDHQNIRKLWCYARTGKTSFYHKFGLKETAHSFVKNRQSYVVMERTF